MTEMTESQRRRFLECLLLDAANDDMGIYPAARIEDGIEHKRTEWQDGWNAYGKGLIDKWCRISDWYAAHSDRHQEITAEMLREEAVSIMVRGDDITLTFNTSDLFAWGYSDCEPITSTEMLEELYEVWKRQPQWGMEAWHCKQMNQQPQWPVEELMRKCGAWDDEMDVLPPCNYDEHIGRWKKQSKADAIAELETRSAPEGADE